MKIHHFNKLDSTNKKARKFAIGDVIIADIQTKGKGKGKRSWYSGKGGIWLSIVLKPRTNNPLELTFLAAVAVRKAILNVTGVKTSIKWPNDILYNNRKLCGILTGAVFKTSLDRMVVGIGLNSNNKIPISLKRKAVSLKEIKGKINNQLLIKSILNNFFGLYKKYEKKGFKLILKQWKKGSMMFGKNVNIFTGRKKYNATVVGVDDDCSLVLKKTDGSRINLVSGDVTIQEFIK